MSDTKAPDHEAARLTARTLYSETEATFVVEPHIRDLAHSQQVLYDENARLREVNDTWADVATDQAGAHVVERLAKIEAENILLRAALATAKYQGSVMSNVCWSLGHADVEVGDREALAQLAKTWDAFVPDAQALLTTTDADHERWLAECATRCTCDPGFGICGGVTSGGICDRMTRDESEAGDD